jgi:NADH:ubiquinone reductase (H+-translocating)
MARSNVYRLRNLGVSTKVAISVALVFCLSLFLSGWVISVAAINWDFSFMTVLDWGGRLGTLGTELRAALFFAHVSSLLALLFTSLALVRRMPLPRLTRRALFAVASVLAVADIAGWALLPFVAAAQWLLGGIVLALALLMTYLVGAPLRAMWQTRRWPGEPEGPVRIVIVGGGFAGLYAALGVDRALGWSEKLELTVIDRKNYFLFPPLLPSVAVGAIETRQITYPFRRIFEATNVRFRKETVERIDLERRVVLSKVDVDVDAEGGAPRVRHDETPFDYLVLAPGSTTQTFNTPGTEHAFFMRELGDAIALRNHIIDCFETAAREPDRELVRKMLRFVVVGAGPTGVEVASEVRDLIDKVLLPRYPEIDPALIDVILIDSGDRVLGGWHGAVAESAEAQLARLGVRVLHQARVSEIGPDWVRLKDGTELLSRTACWCAGVGASPLLARVGLPLDRGHRVAVDPACRAPGHSNVFVLGDACTFPGDDGRPLPPLGQVAFQQGAHTGANLVRLLRGEEARPFRYFDFGQLVSVGHQFASVRLMGVRLSGFLAWFVWRTLYLAKLVGFGNKLRVMLDWSLDLFIERSSSQIHAARERLEAAAAHDHEHTPREVPPTLPSRRVGVAAPSDAGLAISGSVRSLPG